MILLGYIAYKLNQIQKELSAIPSEPDKRIADSIDRWLEKRLEKRLDKADADKCCTHDAHENYCICCMNEHERCRIQD